MYCKTCVNGHSQKDQKLVFNVFMFRVCLIFLSVYCCLLVIVGWLFLAVPWGCLRFVIVVFPDHTHLLFLLSPTGKGWLSLMWCFIVFFPFPMWCPGSLVVLDCINSWSLPDLTFKTNYRLMQVKSIAECSKSKWSILQYLWPSLIYHLQLRPFDWPFYTGLTVCV